jgi:hypothetical protein
MMPAPFTGGCLCGAVRYEVSAEPVAMALCHCRDCQYVSGGEPAAVVIVPRDALKITKGKPKDFTVTGDSGKHVTRRFCAECGTPLFSDVEANPAIWVVKAGSMDDPSWLKPNMVVYTASAQPWAHMDPALPHFAKMPG